MLRRYWRQSYSAFRLIHNASFLQRRETYLVLNLNLDLQHIAGLINRIDINIYAYNCRMIRYRFFVQ